MKRCIVVDLDGTLYTCNTFVRYVFFFLKLLIFNFDIKGYFLCIYYIVLRRLKLITHSHFKKEILFLSRGRLSDCDICCFVGSLDKFVNKDVTSLVEHSRRSGCVTIMATAAPEIYANKIGENYCFERVISTSMPNSLKSEYWIENIRYNKKKHVLSVLEEMDLKLSFVVTDHHDDAPILAISEINYLVKPSVKTIKIVDDLNINYIII